MDKIIITGQDLIIEEVARVARDRYHVEIHSNTIGKINGSRNIVDSFVEKEEVVYGITTGFGRFSDIVISSDETQLLQKNLIMSHSCGVGEAFSTEITRAIMLLRANALCKGFSGIRLGTLNLLIDMINKGVHPVIPQKGSLGASGDLAPLAHMVLVMIGKGKAELNGEIMSGMDALNKVGLKPVTLSSKEGLALINGTPVMTAVAALTLYDARVLMKTADLNAALTLEALRGIVDAFDSRIHEARGHRGQITSAQNILRLLEGSEYVTRQGELRVQDAYALRCTPQVHGACRDSIEYIWGVIEKELNAATDNPLIFPDSCEVISGGNFHGEPVALAMDFLGITLSEIANISERRLERLVNPQLSNGLPAFLTKHGGLNSGFMITQYSAAALVSENKVLAHPASVDSIPSSANQEDHVSMGTIAARKSRDIKNNTANVLAIELLAAAQAVDLREKREMGKGTGEVYRLIREKVLTLEDDRVMYEDMQKVLEIIMSEEPVKKVEQLLGSEL